MPSINRKSNSQIRDKVSYLGLEKLKLMLKGYEMVKINRLALVPFG